MTVRELSDSLRNIISGSSTVFLSCTKGIEHGSGMRMSEIIETFFPTNVVAVLSGPNLAIEVSRGLPTATVIGCREQSVAEILQRELGGSRFRVYTTDELTGAELGGALKNIFAIAAGISDGFGLEIIRNQRWSLVPLPSWFGLALRWEDNRRPSTG